MQGKHNPARLFLGEGSISESHKYPNIALMKISAWHKLQGDSVSWYIPLMSNMYDRIYSSKVFTFSK